MTTELSYLAWTLVLTLVQIVVTAQFFTLANGLTYAAGSRDTAAPRRMPVVGERVERATRNLMETLPLAIGAILIAHAAGRHNAYTVWGATLYFWGRLVYVGIYAAGIAYVRTLVWLVSVLGIILVLLGLRFG